MISSVLIYVSIPSDNHVFGQQSERYYVHSSDTSLKERLGVVQDFNDTYSTLLTNEQINDLRKNGIKIEPVTVFQLEYIKDQKLNNSINNNPLTLFDQIPWGVKRMYDDANMTVTKGGNEIKVVVMDTGVLKNHPDLKSRLSDCKDFTGVKIKNSCTDGNGHGTHVSGTILADGGHDKNGIYGMAPQASLLAYKVCSDNGLCFGDSIAKALMTAADTDVNIVSMSFGALSMSSVEKNALDYADSKGVLLVAAAGNSGPNLSTINYPAAYDKVIAVAATDINNSVTDFSSRGINDGDFIIEEREVEVSAPGEGIQSTWNDGGYRALSGTSMATPHISGLAAKLWSLNVTDFNHDGVIVASEVRLSIDNLAMKNDIVNGLHSSIGDDPASGLGLPKYHEN